MNSHFLLPLPVNNPTYAANAPSNFKLPPLDGSLTLPEIYDWHLVHNPRHAFFIYENSSAGYNHLTYSDIVPAADRAAQFVTSATQMNVNNSASLSPVAIVASSDTITHFCTLLGLMRAGIQYITITPRNSASIIAYLIDKVDAKHVLFSSEPIVINVVESACNVAAKEFKRELKPVPMPLFDDIFRREPYQVLGARRYGLDDTVIYTHSSGSTSLPRPIPWTHAFLLQCAVAPLFGHHNFCNEIFAWHSASMSHGTGVHLLPFMPATGMIVAVFPPANPAQYPSPSAAFQSFANVKADYLVSFPNLIETWSEDPKKVEILKTAKGVVFTGSMLNKRVGDSLAAAGVTLFSLFGMAEAGIVGTMFPPSPGIDWDYITLTPHGGGHFLDAGDDLHELIIVEQPLKRLPIANMKFGKANAHASRDLFIEHPSKPGFWRPCGRKDDRIIHPNGEKTNPTLMEHIIALDPQVKTALIFGNGRSQVGLLVQLEDEFVFDPSDEVRLQAFRTYIHPRIVEANVIASTYSQIYPEMILTTNPAKPFLYTEKGSLRRAAVLSSYEQEVNSLYKWVETHVLSGVKLPSSWSPSNSLQFVLAILDHEGLKMKETDNMFYNGCDSLKATRIEIIIRNALKRVVDPSIPVDLLRNFIYDYPTPKALATFLSDRASSDAIIPKVPQSAIVTMNQLIDRFCFSFPTRELLEAPKPTSGAVILLTGTTGALGANLLAVLAIDPSVSHIYALNRASDDISITEKQKAALSSRGLSPDLAVQSNVTLLVGHLAAEGLGLEPHVRDEMRRSVTHIFHLAWNINWNIPLSSYEGLIHGLRNLIDFALSSQLPEPPHLVFSSTISVFRNVKPGFFAFEQSLEDLEVATGQGYSESKAVAEKIIERAVAETPLKAVITRIGQASGNRSGAWNVSDWFPAMIKSSLTLGSLPDVKGIASFIPADIVAQTLNDVRDSDVPVIHISHPQPVPFSSLMEPFSRELALPLVPHHQWVESLERLESRAVVDDTINHLPALKILQFFRLCDIEGASGGEIFGLPTLSTQISTTLSTTLACTAPLTSKDAMMWLAYWKQTGFI